MTTVMLNTIALEPNRWTATKIPHRDLTELLPLIAGAGFTALELWQYHLTGKSLTEVEALKKEIDRRNLSVPVLGAYPAFHLTGAAEEAESATRTALLHGAMILGCRVIKIFLGRIKGSDITPDQLALTAHRLTRWLEAGRAFGIRFCAELHANTLFDPEPCGTSFLAAHPELDLSVCYQPYDFQSTEASLALAGRFAGKIIHVHLQGHGADESIVPLEEGVLDYRKIIPRLRNDNPCVTWGIEFVRGGMKPAAEFDCSAALADAVKDKTYVERILALA